MTAEGALGVGEATLRARLQAAGIAAPRAESVVVDLAGDAPLAGNEEAIAVEEAGRVVAGMGAALIAARAQRGVVVVRSEAAERALGRALMEAGAKAEIAVARVAAVWPSHGVAPGVVAPWAWLLAGERVLDLEAAALGRARAPRRLTVAGEVARPGVFTVAITSSITVEEAVDRAGGATDTAWVALDGGAPAGRLAARDDRVTSGLVLVLPQEHALVRRARTPVADWVLRAASACEGCRACTDACPVHLSSGTLVAHELVAQLALSRDAGTRLADAAACIRCGVCDVACPSALSPFALVAAVRSRLPRDLLDGAKPDPRVVVAAPPAHPDRALRRLAIDVLVDRLGLGAYRDALAWKGGTIQPSRSA